ncbi:MAG: hypothetical protein R3321_02245 [Nitrososphaeraceae archaeon]|nr:hypothetical protein [Nitrososphaeraceae archaeon]
MPTNKNRVQGYLSDTAYQYLENYRIENELKSQSSALEHLLETLALKGSSDSLESETYNKLKIELKSELKSDLYSSLQNDLLNDLRHDIKSEIDFQIALLGNAKTSHTHDSLKVDFESDPQNDENLPALSNTENQANKKLETVSPEILETFADHFCIATIRENLAYFWDSHKRELSNHFPTIYKSKRSAKTSLTKLKKQGLTDLEIYDLVEFFDGLDPKQKDRLLPFIQNAVKDKS